MRWIKAVLTFFTIVIIPMVLMNLLLGRGTQSFIQLLKFQLYGIIFAVPFIATCLIFSSEFEKTKKIKWMWRVLLIYLGIIAVLSLLGFVFLKGDAGWTLLVFVIFGAAYIVGMALATALLSHLLKFEEEKQMKIILVVFLTIILLDLLQLFGLFRPGWME